MATLHLWLGVRISHAEHSRDKLSKKTQGQTTQEKSIPSGLHQNMLVRYGPSKKGTHILQSITLKAIN